MGGKQWRQWPKTQGGASDRHNWAPDYSRQPPWRLWHGAHSASPKNAARPHYDQVTVPGYKGAGKHAYNDEEETPDFQLRREVQKALSAARKADQKVRKLREERQLREAQWTQFQKEARAAFLAEKTRFQGAMERLEQDIQQTTAQGREASALIQTLVARGPAALPARQPDPAEDEGWEELTKEEEPALEAGFLRDAMLAARHVPVPAGAPVPSDGRMVPPEVAAQVLQAVMASLLAFSASATAPMQAPAGPTPAPTGPEPPMTGPTAPAVPYNSSPKTTAPEVVSNAGTAATASPGTHPRAKRTPVKGAPVRPVHTGTGEAAKLADKLQAKRHAMRPFGVVSKSDETQVAIELDELDLEHMAPAHVGEPTEEAMDTGQPSPTAAPAP